MFVVIGVMGLLEEQTRRRVVEEVVFPLIEADTGQRKTRKQPDDENQSVDGDKANIALLVFLYTLQGIPLGLASALPMILQNKGVQYKDQVHIC